MLSHFRPKPTNLEWKIKSSSGVSSLGLGKKVDSSHPTTQPTGSSIAKQLPSMYVDDHFSGVKKEFQGDSSDVGYESTFGGSLSRAKTMAVVDVVAYRSFDFKLKFRQRGLSSRCFGCLSAG